MNKTSPNVLSPKQTTPLGRAKESTYQNTSKPFKSKQFFSERRAPMGSGWILGDGSPFVARRNGGPRGRTAVLILDHGAGDALQGKWIIQENMVLTNKTTGMSMGLSKLDYFTPISVGCESGKWVINQLTNYE